MQTTQCFTPKNDPHVFCCSWCRWHYYHHCPFQTTTFTYHCTTITMVLPHSSITTHRFPVNPWLSPASGFMAIPGRCVKYVGEYHGTSIASMVISSYIMLHVHIVSYSCISPQRGSQHPIVSTRIFLCLLNYFQSIFTVWLLHWHSNTHVYPSDVGELGRIFSRREILQTSLGFWGKGRKEAFRMLRSTDQQWMDLWHVKAS